MEKVKAGSLVLSHPGPNQLIRLISCLGVVSPYPSLIQNHGLVHRRSVFSVWTRHAAQNNKGEEMELSSYRLRLKPLENALYWLSHPCPATIFPLQVPSASLWAEHLPSSGATLPFQKCHSTLLSLADGNEFIINRRSQLVLFASSSETAEMNSSITNVWKRTTYGLVWIDSPLVKWVAEYTHGQWPDHM